MTIRTQRRLLWITTALCVLAVVVVWGHGASGNSKSLGTLDDQSTSKPRSVESPASGSDSLIPGLSEFRSVWDRPLRQALYDPPPPPPPEVSPPPPLRIKLLGTILEPGNSEAIVMTSGGEMKMLRVGAVIEDATVETIEDNQITVTYHDQNLTLTPQPQ